MNVARGMPFGIDNRGHFSVTHSDINSWPYLFQIKEICSLDLARGNQDSGVHASEFQFLDCLIRFKLVWVVLRFAGMPAPLPRLARVPCGDCRITMLPTPLPALEPGFLAHDEAYAGNRFLSETIRWHVQRLTTTARTETEQPLAMLYNRTTYVNEKQRHGATANY